MTTHPETALGGVHFEISTAAGVGSRLRVRYLVQSNSTVRTRGPCAVEGALCWLVHSRAPGACAALQCALQSAWQTAARHLHALMRPRANTLPPTAALVLFTHGS